MVGHGDRLIMDQGQLKMTVSGQKPPVAYHPAVQTLGVAEYDLKWPVDGVNLTRETLLLIQVREEHTRS